MPDLFKIAVLALIVIFGLGFAFIGISLFTLPLGDVLMTLFGVEIAVGVFLVVALVLYAASFAYVLYAERTGGHLTKFIGSTFGPSAAVVNKKK
jgi:hypothetical protein